MQVATPMDMDSKIRKYEIVRLDGIIGELKKENEKLRQLVKSAYYEGFYDGLGDVPPSESWEESQSYMCLNDGFDLANKES